jgi:hypothetical protein
MKKSHQLRASNCSWHGLLVYHPPLSLNAIALGQNSERRAHKRLDFLARRSVHASRPPGTSEPRAASAPAGMTGGARAGDGASGRPSHPKEVQIMTKTNKKAATKTAARRPRQGAGQPAASRNRRKQATPPAAAAPTAPAASRAAAPARQTKKGSILALLQRPKGAAIGELIEATGWQVHSVRAALTGLRKEGKELVRDKNEAGATLYRIPEAR